MYWGAGPALGLLTCIGYLFLALGAARVWRNRDDFSIWVHDEISIFRRAFARYTPVGPVYIHREDSRFRAIPTSFVGSLSRLPRSRINGAAILVVVGLLLFLLDFFV
jgi:hypothetical protein